MNQGGQLDQGDTFETLLRVMKKHDLTMTFREHLQKKFLDNL